ncbi:isochorismatase family protein [Actinospica durhamensis]|uniref:Isochorismatase family protein n=1 Tax=Actinospica durhamensis TaxID=1508375 RepID=A0A941IPF4_9ACTN|nr:isochorismatase family protein [Actinospica durhamensis]MBR7831898.1 isochorismatase family protein [Actinospica durhamensis]
MPIPSIASYPLPTRAGLPAAKVPWTPDPSRAVLLVHDMQGYFVNTLPEPLRGELLHNAATLRKRCAELGVPVAYTAQPGRMTPEERGLLVDFWGPGMRTLPQDRLIVPELAPAQDDWLLTKWRYSAFARSDLGERMAAAGRDQIVLCGVYAHIGVLATALDALARDTQAFLVADAVGDFSESYHAMAVEYAAERCARVLTAEEVFA